MSGRYFLKENTDLHNRILEAERVLDQLGLQINFYIPNDGIIIEDVRSGKEFKTDNQCMEFPRSIDGLFILI